MARSIEDDGMMFGKRILILVPHPDDEVVACAAAIGRAQAGGAKIFALYLTNGCIARETLWPWQRKYYEGNVARRRVEAETVAKYLNIDPLGWSPRPARHLWKNLPQVRTAIQEAVEHYAIDQIWVPAYEGGNADHDALNAVSCLFSKTINVLEFAEYNFFKNKTRSQEFPEPNGTERTLVLTPEEQQMKRKALALYASEKQNLSTITTERECYRPLTFYNYNEKPHDGTLWYTRFQWVPFRHPRVDFTDPKEVSKAITSFLGLDDLLPEACRPQEQQTT